MATSSICAHLYTDVVAHVQVLNTSFNVMKEPIVDSPEDAVRYVSSKEHRYQHLINAVLCHT
jgi:predicted NodU family carbamoyl transferase